MNIFMRVLLAVYSLCLTIITLIAMFITFSPDTFDSIANYISFTVLPSQNYKIFLFFIELLFFAASIVFLLSGFKSDKEKKAISKFTEIGEIRISLNSLETIALTASKRVSGIKDSKAIVLKSLEGVSIMIRAVVLADVNIPMLSQDVQVKVKKSVEETSGVKVNEVKVVVENIHAGYKSRVE